MHRSDGTSLGTACPLDARGVDGHAVGSSVACGDVQLVRIESPTQARHAIRYVLGNWRKHGEDRSEQSRTWLVDPFSSAISFPDWAELQGQALMWPIRATYDPLIVFRPKTWILAEGWKCCGDISARDVPSRRH